MLDILNRDELHKIDLTTMKILETVGLEMHDKRALKILDEAGAMVDYNKKKVKIPEYLVRDCIKKAPSQFSTYGRRGIQRVKHGGDHINFICGLNSPNILDLENGLRSTTLKDVEAGARLVDALDNIQVTYAMGTPQDVPLEMQLLHSFEATLRNTEKPIEVEVGSGEVLRYCFKMVSAVVGGEEEMKKRPVYSSTIEISSPLKFHKPQTDMLYESSIRGIPMKIISCPISGVSGPVTLAGALAQSNAEVLVGITLAQLINPSTPVIFETAPLSFDMRTALITFGSPETILMQVASLQLGHYYGLPTRSSGTGTNEEVPGVQAGYEKMLSGITVALAGSNGISNLGTIGSSSSISFVQAVVDDEMAGLITRFIRGFEVNHETLAFDVIRKVAVEGTNFLLEKHTREHFRKEHLIPRLSNRLSRRDWEKAGAKEIREKAKERAKEIFKTHYPEPLDRDIGRELEKILDQARKDLVRG